MTVAIQATGTSLRGNEMTVAIQATGMSLRASEMSAAIQVLKSVKWLKMITKLFIKKSNNRLSVYNF